MFVFTPKAYLKEDLGYINCTPHEITIQSREWGKDATILEPSGIVVRVEQKFTPIEHGLCHAEFGKVINLPSPEEGVGYVVSGMVLSAVEAENRNIYWHLTEHGEDEDTHPDEIRLDVFAPATGHPPTERNDKGHIVSVPCLIAPTLEGERWYWTMP